MLKSDSENGKIKVEKKTLYNIISRQDQTEGIITRMAFTIKKIIFRHI